MSYLFVVKIDIGKYVRYYRVIKVQELLFLSTIPRSLRQCHITHFQTCPVDLQSSLNSKKVYICLG